MRASKNEKVAIFLNELQTADSTMFDSIVRMRAIIFKTYPEVEEKMMYGGILFSVDNEMFCGLFAYSKHVSLEFSNGYLMDDPKGHLEGKGKLRRHLKILTLEDIESKNVESFVKQAH